MSKTNCVNCGAAKDIDALRCPFCGTTYLDLTAIDFESGKPVVCQFVLPYSDRSVVSMVAIPVLEEFGMEYSDSIEITSLEDSHKRYIHCQSQLHCNVAFHPVTQKNGVIFDFRKGDL